MCFLARLGGQKDPARVVPEGMWFWGHKYLPNGLNNHWKARFFNLASFCIWHLLLIFKKKKSNFEGKIHGKCIFCPFEAPFCLHGNSEPAFNTSCLRTLGHSRLLPSLNPFGPVLKKLEHFHFLAGFPSVKKWLPSPSVWRKGLIIWIPVSRNHI